MGNYTTQEISAIDILLRKYAEEFAINRDMLQETIKGNSKIGDDLLRSIWDANTSAESNKRGYKNYVTFNILCECVSIDRSDDGMHWYVYDGEREIIREYLHILSDKHPQNFKALLEYIQKAQSLVEKNKALNAMAHAHFYLASKPDTTYSNLESDHIPLP